MNAVLPRSYLFVPAGRPERYAKALASGADAIIIDLEDAVAPDAKSAARAALIAAWPPLAGDERALIRVNASGTAWVADDLKACAALRPQCVVVPKVERADELARIAAALPPETALLPMIESALGWANLTEIARAASVQRLVFGSFDFQADLGLECDDDEGELMPVRLAITAASRVAELAPPVDGVTLQTGDAGRLRADTLRARRLGFGAKLCIHPNQVRAVHEALAPDAAELAWARRVVEAAAAADGAATTLDGKMIDLPVVLRAQRVLSLAPRD